VFQSRASAGGDTDTTTDTGSVPTWVRLVRAGNIFTAYRSDDGANWVQVGDPVTIDMAADAQVGLAVTSHNGMVLNASTFENVAVRPASPGPVPAPSGGRGGRGGANPASPAPVVDVSALAIAALDARGAWGVHAGATVAGPAVTAPLGQEGTSEGR